MLTQIISFLLQVIPSPYFQFWCPFVILQPTTPFTFIHTLIHTFTHCIIHISITHWYPFPRSYLATHFKAMNFEGHFRGQFLRYLQKGNVLKLGLTLISLSSNKPFLVLDLDFKSSKPTQRQRSFPNQPYPKGMGAVIGLTSHPQLR